MQKSFTLIELLVTVTIIVLLAAAAGPAIKSHQDQANLDTAVQAIKDGILETQALAFAPDREDAGHYDFVLNITSTTQPYYSQNIAPYSYAILEIPYATGETPGGGSVVSNERNFYNKFIVSDAHITFTPRYPLDGGPSVPANDFFKVHFRTYDGVAGFAGIYNNYSDPTVWNNLWGSPASDYAELDISFANKTKRIRIHKITGQIEVWVLKPDGTWSVV